MAYLALYRRYRPQTFDEVVGQAYVTRILKNQILHNRIAHAYLLTGIRGTGKTSIAKIFARAVNCPHTADGNPCNTCEVCTQIDKPGISDIIEIDAASNRGVDEIRDIREKVKYPPVKGRYKVYIIDEVHMLTKEAFNALLKTLEEPPAHIIFILATTEPNKLPMTILSRCQRYDIRPIATEEITERMKTILNDIGVSIEDDALTFIAARGSHSMRDALSLLDQIIDIREGDNPITREQVLDFLGMADSTVLADVLAAVINRDAPAALGAVRTLYTSGKDAALLVDQLIETLRDVIIAGVSGSGAADVIGCGKSTAETYAAMATTCGKNRLFEMADTLIETRGKMRYSDMADVILEMSLLSLCVDKPKASAIQTPPSSDGKHASQKRIADVKKPDNLLSDERSLREMMGLPAGNKSNAHNSPQPGNVKATAPETSTPEDFKDSVDASDANPRLAPDTREPFVKGEPSIDPDDAARPKNTPAYESSNLTINPLQPDPSVQGEQPASNEQLSQREPDKPSDNPGHVNSTEDTKQFKNDTQDASSLPSDAPDQTALINPDVLLRALQRSVPTLSKGILFAGVLDHCRLAERGGTLVFRAEKTALRICEEMIKDRDFINLIHNELSFVPTLKAEIDIKDFEEMSFVEKTKSILEDHPVEFKTSP